MKKVKTLLMSLLILTATAFVSACSCSSSGDPNAPVVPEKEITISCEEYTGSNVNVIYDPVSKELDIKCNSGDTLYIQYLLSPEDATTTTVNWDVSDTSVISCDTYTYSKTISEKVEFVAGQKGSATITFSTASNKTAVAHVEVAAKIANLPSFSKIDVEDISYNSTNGRLTWKEPSTMITALGEVKDITEEARAGLLHYEVTILNLEDNSTSKINVGAGIRYVDNFVKGARYAVSVKPIGNRYTANDGENSDDFKFCQLEAVSELAVVNGAVSFTTSKHSSEHRIFPDYDPQKSNNIYESRHIEAGVKYSNFNYTNFKNFNGSVYNIAVQSFPAYYDASLNYGKILNSGVEEEGMRCYPSNVSEVKRILKLVEPELSITNLQGVVDIKSDNGTFSTSSIATQHSVLNIDSGKEEGSLSGLGVEYHIIVRKTSSDNSGEIVYSSAVNLDTKTLHLNNLWSKATKNSYQFTIFVQKMGDQDKTIPSTSSQYKINVPVLNDESWTIDGSILRVPCTTNYAQLELYLKNTADNSISIVKQTKPSDTADVTYDLSAMGIRPGNYKLYGKYVGSNQNSGSITSDVFSYGENTVLYFPKSIDTFTKKSNGDFSITVPTVTNEHGDEVYAIDDNALIELRLTSGTDTKLNVILYNGDDTTDYSSFIGSDGISTTVIYPYTRAYTTVGVDKVYENKITFNFFDMLKHVYNNDNVAVNSFFAEADGGYKEFKYSFSVKGYSSDAKVVGINSAYTPEQTLVRLGMPNAVTIENDELTFEAIPNATYYPIEVTVGSKVYTGTIVPKYKPGTENKIIAKPLSDISVKDGDGESQLLSEVLGNLSVDRVNIKFRSQGNFSNTALWLDGGTNSITYDAKYITSSLSSVSTSMTLDGVFTWSTPTTLTGEYVAPQDPDDNGGDEGAETQDEEESDPPATTPNIVILETNVKYKVFVNKGDTNIHTKTLIPVIVSIDSEGKASDYVINDADKLEILKTLQDGQCALLPKGAFGNNTGADMLFANLYTWIKGNTNVLNVVVKEVNSNKFTATGTNPYYVSTLQSVIITKTTVGDENKIVWNAVADASGYDIFVGDTFQNSTTDTSLNVSTYASSVGTYLITVKAKADNTGSDVGKLSTKPFVMYGEDGEDNIAIIRVVSEKIKVTANDDYIEWNNICSQGTKYTVKIGSKIIYIGSVNKDGIATPCATEGERQLVTTTGLIRLDLSSYVNDLVVGYDNVSVSGTTTKEGKTTVVVEPTIDFASTGYILNGTTYTENKVRKLNAPTVDPSSVTDSGRLKVTVDDDTENLYIEVNGNDISGLFSIEKSGSVRYITFETDIDGSMTISIKAIKKGTLSSDALVLEGINDIGSASINVTLGDGETLAVIVDGGILTEGYTLTAVTQDPENPVDYTHTLTFEEGVLAVATSLEIQAVNSSDPTHPTTLKSYHGVTKLSTVEDFERVIKDDTPWFEWSAVTGVTSYEIEAWNVVREPVEDDTENDENTEEGGGEGSGENGNGEGNGGTASITEETEPGNEGESGSGEEELPELPQTEKEERKTITLNVSDVGSAKFKYENGKYYYAFDEEELGVSAGSGDYKFRIKPTTTNYYLNGSYSSANQITKLNNVVTVSYKDGMISVSGYEANGTETPVKIKYTVSPYKVVEKSVTTGSGEDAVTTTTNEVEYDTANIKSDVVDYADLVTLDLMKLNNLFTLPTYDYYSFEVQIVFIGDGESSINSNICIPTENELNLNGYPVSRLGVTSLSTVNGVVAIKDIADATSYTLEINGVEVDVPVTAGTKSTEWTSSVTGMTAYTDYAFNTNTKYTLRVRAHGDVLSGAWSEPFDVYKLEAPIGYDEKGIYIYEDAGIPYVTWKDGNAYGTDYKYKILYTQSDDEVTFTPVENIKAITTSKGSIAHPLSTNIATGVYYLLFRTNGTTSGTNTVGFLNSEYVNGTKVNYISETSSLAISNGELTWKGVDGARYYKVTIEGCEPIITSDTRLSVLDFPDITGTKTITVNSIVSPATAIISTYTVDEEEAPNTMKVYRPKAPSDVKVLNGELSWTVSLSDVVEFALANPSVLNPSTGGGNEENGGEQQGASIMADTSDNNVTLIDYIVNVVNGNNNSTADEDFKSSISHLINVTLKLTDRTIEVVADRAEVIDSSGTPVKITEVSDALELLALLGNGKIRYYYNVVSENINPHLPSANSQIQEEGDDLGGDTGDGSDTDTGDGSDSDSTQEEVIEFKSGHYKVQISARGNSFIKGKDTTTPDEGTVETSSVNNSVAILSSKFTSIMEVYKPVSPVTDTQIKDNLKYDMDNGIISWSLVRNGVLESGQTEEGYHTEYVLEVYNDSTKDGIKATITLGDGNSIQPTQGLVVDNNWAKIHILDVFTVDSLKNLSGNSSKTIVFSDTEYKVRVYAKGTVDSETATGQLYLNSDKRDFIDFISILDKPTEIEMELNNVRWAIPNTSVYTLGKIYSLGNNLGETDTDATQWADTWTDWTGLTETEQQEKLIFQKDFRTDTKDRRINEYTLTDKEYYDEVENVNVKYPAGKYAFTFQEMGNEKGVVDSLVSDYYYYYKLDATEKVELVKSGNYKGMFAWKSVPFANAYYVQLYRVSVNENPQEGEDDTITTRIYTRMTTQSFTQGEDTYYYYDLPDFKYDSADKFFIAVQACRVKNTAEDHINTDIYVENTPANDNSKYYLESGWFMGDTKISASYARINPIEVLTIARNGSISWDKVDTAGSYNVKYGDTREVTIATTNNPNTTIQSDGGNISIQVKSIVPTGNENDLLNSRYSDKINVIKLYDPVPRIIGENGNPSANDGNLTWMYNNQPGTSAEYYSEVIIDGDITIKRDTAIIDDEPRVFDINLDTLTLYYYTDLEKVFAPKVEEEIPSVEEDEENTEETTNIKDLIESYSYAEEIEKYPEGNHTFDISYIGALERVSLNENTTSSFFISSNSEHFEAIKLPAPNDVAFAKLEFGGNIANRLSWTKVPYANDYNIYRIAVTTSAEQVTSYTVLSLKNISTYSDRFNTDTESGKVYFNIDGNVADNISIIQGGASNYFFVQAVGDTDEFNSIHYLNSSYCEPKVIDSPVAPSNIKVANGKVTWAVNTTNTYNVGVVLTYKVNDVETLDGYWNNTITNVPYSNIQKRVISRDASTNIATITDYVLLKSSDTEYNGKTPTWYKLTNIATYTSISLFTIASEEIEIANGQVEVTDFMSAVVYYNENNTPKQYVFSMFASGDGTVETPYIIGKSEDLKNITYFTERNFKLDVNSKVIEVNAWSTIMGTLTGTIDGNDHTIKGFSVNISSNSAGQIMTSFIENNNGTIKNLTIEVTGSALLGQNGNMNVSIVANNNMSNGVIDNVDVVGKSTYFLRGEDTGYNVYINTHGNKTYGIVVGGLVVNNAGTITNSNVDLDIYAVGTEDCVITTGGIANVSSNGTITSSTYTGNITSNYIGGLVYSATNTTITDCTVGGDGTPSQLTSITHDNGAFHKHSIVGGLVGQYLSTSTKTISNSNVYVNITLDVKASAGRYELGGVIAVIDKDSSANVQLSGVEVEVAFDSEMSGLAESVTSAIWNNTFAYLFTPSNRFVSCVGCTYKNNTTSTFSIQNYIPSGVFEN